MANTGFAERVAYGTPLSTESERNETSPIHLVPRAGTALTGRLLLAGIFLILGFAKLADLGGTAAFMESVGIPQAPTLALIAAIAEIAGGLAIAAGFLTRLGALGLAIYLIPTTLIFHRFWNVGGADAQMQLVNFLKNLAIIGGLLVLYAYGPGRYSIDARLRRPMQP